MIRLEVDKDHSKPVEFKFKSGSIYFEQEVFLFNGSRYPEPIVIRIFDLLEQLPTGMFELEEGCFKTVELMEKGSKYSNKYTVLNTEPKVLKKYITKIDEHSADLTSIKDIPQSVKKAS